MSCIRFSTRAQRAAMAGDAAALDPADAAALHLSPPVTASKIARLRLLAEHERPGIRQSAAASRAASADLLERLAGDPEPAVRGEVARNEQATPDLLVRLAADPDARVRCWAVLNPALPDDAARRLLDDADAQVARLAGWRAGVPQPA